jgi:crotonobetainyl-CoA:carnitine CoA-transferase CaiB-like acyl-CoA transferase
MVVDVEHPTIGAMKLAGRPIKFPGARQPPVTPPPSFGQHTASVLRTELGYSDSEIDALRRAGVIDRMRPRGG